MAQNTSPVFLKAAVGDVVQISTANAARDGSGTLGTVATGVADGKRVNVVRIKATVTTTTGVVRLYYSADSGVTNRLIGEVLVAAITASATVAAFEADWIPPGGSINLVGTTDMLRASTEKAETFNLLALGGSYAA